MEWIGDRASHDAAGGEVRVLARLRLRRWRAPPRWRADGLDAENLTQMHKSRGVKTSGPLHLGPRGDALTASRHEGTKARRTRRLLLCVFVVFATSCLRAAGTSAQDLPPPLAARFAEGVSALQAGRLDAAEAAFRAVIAGGGDRAFVRHNLGIVLQRRGRHADALVEFRAASRLDPAFGPSRLLAGASLLGLGQAPAAVAELRRASELMPKEPAVHLQLADACERIDDVVCLANQYRTLVELAPANPEYAYRLGKAYLKLSQWAHARMQAIDPRGARLNQALGREYLEQGRRDLAERAFLDAVNRDPTLEEVHLALARIYLADGRVDDAARAVARALALVPESKAARVLQTSVDAARGRR
jgi:predicted Zn-dependent protease